jgi:hypothetical protein
MNEYSTKKNQQASTEHHADNPRFLAFLKHHGITSEQFFDPSEYISMLPFILWISEQKERYFEKQKLTMPRSNLDRQTYDHNDWTAFLWEVANNEPTKTLIR